MFTDRADAGERLAETSDERNVSADVWPSKRICWFVCSISM